MPVAVLREDVGRLAQGAGDDLGPPAGAARPSDDGDLVPGAVERGPDEVVESRVDEHEFDLALALRSAHFGEERAGLGDEIPAGLDLEPDLATDFGLDPGLRLAPRRRESADVEPRLPGAVGDRKPSAGGDRLQSLANRPREAEHRR